MRVAGAQGPGRMARAWRSCLVLAGGTMAAMSAAAGEPPVESGPFLDLRYRYSNLYSQSAPLRGHANTARLQLGYRWAIGDGWSTYVEGTAVRSLFGRQYDDTSDAACRIRSRPIQNPPASPMPGSNTATTTCACASAASTC